MSAVMGAAAVHQDVVAYITTTAEFPEIAGFADWAALAEWLAGTEFIALGNVVSITVIKRPAMSAGDAR